jgi:hypothetical protein
VQVVKTRFPIVAEPRLAVLALKSVVEARFDTKRLVEVALVEVELPVMLKSPATVEEAEEMKPESSGRVEKTILPVPVSSSKREMSSLEASMSFSMMMLETPVRVSSSAKLSIEVVETLLSNLVQSAESKQPKTEEEAVSQSMSFTVRVKPSPKVRMFS